MYCNITKCLILCFREQYAIIFMAVNLHIFSHLQIKHLAVVLTRTNNTAEYISVHFMAYYLLHNNSPWGMFRCGGHPWEKTRLRGHPREKTRLRGQGLEVNPREKTSLWGEGEMWRVSGVRIQGSVTGAFNLLHEDNLDSLSFWIYPFCAGTVCKRQNLTSMDVRFWL